MEKRKINAKEAVADIRDGMDDSALMGKYNLSPTGLQSLFDKLVNGGFIDLSEMQGRLRGFWGTVVISDPVQPEKGLETPSIRQPPQTKSPPRINAQESARDIRLGMNDAALMEKYRLSSRGLRTLFDKLVYAGLISDDEIERRYRGIDDTVDLREEMLTLSSALRLHGIGAPASPTGDKKPPPKQPMGHDIVKNSANKEKAPSQGQVAKSPQEAKLDAEPNKKAQYSRSIAVSLLFMALFPLGLYALYKSPIVSAISDFFKTTAWKLWNIACQALQLN